MKISDPSLDAEEIFALTETPEQALIRRAQQTYDPEHRPWTLSPEPEARRQALLAQKSATWRAQDSKTAHWLRDGLPIVPTPEEVFARLAEIKKRRPVLLPKEDWRENLRLTKQGRIKEEIDNVLDIFQLKPFWQHPTIHPDSPYFDTPGGRFAYDEMTDTPCILLEPLGPDGDLALGQYELHSLTARHEQEFTWVRYALSRALRMKVEKFLLWDAILYMAHLREFHPVRQYLRSLQWDGTSRLLWLAQEVLGIEKPTPIQVTMLGRWLISCVARTMKPGCQVDTVLVLCGDQGLRKSSFFRALAGPWFSDSPINLGHKDSFQQTANSWIYEWAEMGKIIRSKDRDDVKLYITSATDNYRAPYERKSSNHPRSMVFVGTTNDLEFLNDPTGSRRFWVLPAHKPLDLAKLQACRDQLWAEAVADYDHGTPWYLTETEETERAEACAPYELEVDVWHREISSYLDRRSLKAELTTNEILGGPLGLEKKDFSLLAQQRVGKVLLDLGYRSVQPGGRKDRRRVWRR